MIIVKGYLDLINMHSYKKFVVIIVALIFNVFVSIHFVT
jgi:hypothetical protein